VNPKASWPTYEFESSYHICLPNCNRPMLLLHLQRRCDQPPFSISCLAYIKTRISICLHVYYHTVLCGRCGTVRRRTAPCRAVPYTVYERCFSFSIVSSVLFGLRFPNKLGSGLLRSEHQLTQACHSIWTSVRVLR
jgi:hypothetical protein